jgi:hypothetical protein
MAASGRGWPSIASGIAASPIGSWTFQPSPARRPDFDVTILARDQQDLLNWRDFAVVGELDAAVVGGGRGREHLDDQPWLGTRAGAALGERAGDDQIGLIPGVGAIHGNYPGLDNHAAGGLQPRPNGRGQIGDDSAVRLDRRRHGAQPPVDQLVTGVGAVVPFQELSETHALRCRLGHAPRIDVASVRANRFEGRGARPGNYGFRLRKSLALAVVRRKHTASRHRARAGDPRRPPPGHGGPESPYDPENLRLRS